MGRSRQAPNDAVDMGVRDTVPACKLGLGYTASLPQGSYLEDIRIAQLRHAVALTPDDALRTPVIPMRRSMGGPALLDHVLRIVFVRPQHEVIWTAAGACIARVHDNLIVRYRAICEHISQSMCLPPVTLEKQLPIAIAQNRACPRPASVVLVAQSTPEPFHRIAALRAGLAQTAPLRKTIGSLLPMGTTLPALYRDIGSHLAHPWNPPLGQYNIGQDAMQMGVLPCHI